MTRSGALARPSSASLATSATSVAFNFSSDIDASVSPIAEEPEQHQKQVDEIKIQRQRANDRIGPDLARRHRQRHLLETLRIVGRQTGEYDDADKREDELKRVVVPEHPDD